MFSIIANDCTGQDIHKSLNISYTSPFIDLLIPGPEYIKLLNNFNNINFKNYVIEYHENIYWGLYKKIKTLVVPMVKVDNSFFLSPFHYTSLNEFEDKWNRRIERINKNDLIIHLHLRTGIYINHVENIIKIRKETNTRYIFLLDHYPSFLDQNLTEVDENIFMNDQYLLQITSQKDQDGLLRQLPDQKIINKFFNK